MDGPPRVLVVDHLTGRAAVTARYLRGAGFQVAVARDKPTALTQARRYPPNLVVLDAGVTGVDSVATCQELRTVTDAYIILVVTADDEQADTIVGLSTGADDFVVKPVSGPELLARVHAVLRRPRPVPVGARPPPHDTTGPLFLDVVLDRVNRRVTRSGITIELTRTEFDVLAALGERPGATFTRRQLLDKIWGQGWRGDEHLVDVHIAHLRAKLGDDATEPTYIRTVRGVGYALRTQ